MSVYPSFLFFWDFFSSQTNSYPNETPRKSY
jgi:hypothetical protein